MISIMELMEKKTPLTKKYDKKKGMTLVEIMAAIAILSILFVGISGLIIGTAKSEGKADRKLESDEYLKNALLMFESGLVVTLSIFLILSVMISAILIQGQRILVRVDNGAKIQNEVRTALLKIQTEAQKSDEVIISDKFGSFNYNQWILNDASSSARELLRLINDGEDHDKVYVEVNEDDKHQLIEFSINKLTNEIIHNSKNVLISSIEGNDVNTISLDVQEISDSKGNKINKLVTINCSNIVSGSVLNESDYLISFIRGRENIININIGNGNETGDNSGNSDENNNSEMGGDGETEGGESSGSIIDTDLIVNFQVTEDWGSGASWQMEIINNTGKDINIESIAFDFEKQITACYQGEFNSLGNGRYKITNYDWSSYIGKGQTLYIGGQ